MKSMGDTPTIAKQKSRPNRLNQFSKIHLHVCIAFFINAIKAEMDIIRQRIGKTNIFTA